MTVETIREVLGWCSAMNFGVLFVWFLGIILARDWIFRIHSKWFALSKEQFDTIHYAGMAFFKMSIIVFNFVPYLALRIAG